MRATGPCLRNEMAGGFGVGIATTHTHTHHGLLRPKTEMNFVSSMPARVAVPQFTFFGTSEKWQIQ